MGPDPEAIPEILAERNGAHATLRTRRHEPMLYIAASGIDFLRRLTRSGKGPKPMRFIAVSGILPAVLLTLTPAFPAGRFYLDVILPGGSSERVDVTVENGPPADFSQRIFGKGNQLQVDAGDFPTLARTGLHSEAELASTKTITGRPVEEINRIARPGGISGAGFLAPGEDILSVLKADNGTVVKLGLTHPQLAVPVYHLWNLELWAYATGRMGRFAKIDHILYGGRKLNVRIESSKGWQESIFDDEIRGNSQIEVSREFSEPELSFLASRYSPERLALVQSRLGRIHTGEMVGYYIMRYGFYEGHTEYRADPLAIAFIFGLRNVEELEAAFPGALDTALNGRR